MPSGWYGRQMLARLGYLTVGFVINTSNQLIEERRNFLTFLVQKGSLYYSSRLNDESTYEKIWAESILPWRWNCKWNNNHWACFEWVWCNNFTLSSFWLLLPMNYQYDTSSKKRSELYSFLLLPFAWHL